jgi:hypothetical protein
MFNTENIFWFEDDIRKSKDIGGCINWRKLSRDERNRSRDQTKRAILEGYNIQVSLDPEDHAKLPDDVASLTTALLHTTE